MAHTEQTGAITFPGDVAEHRYGPRNMSPSDWGVR
jgi:hypothetical protein